MRGSPVDSPDGGARSATDEVARCYAHLAFPSGAKQSSGLFRGPLQRWMRFSTVTLVATIILQEPTQASETYQKMSRMINKVQKISEYAIIIMVFCVKFGAKGAEGHGIVLEAAPLRLYWLLCRQEKAEHVGLGTVCLSYIGEGRRLGDTKEVPYRIRGNY